MHLSGTLLEIATLLGWTLLHFLWQGLLIGLGHALVSPLLPSARARHNAALLGLLTCLATPAWTFLHLWRAGAASAAIDAAQPAGRLAAAAATAGAGSGGQPSWLALLAMAWLFGLGVIVLSLWTDWRRLRRVIRDSLPAPAFLDRMLARELARIGLRRPVRLRLTGSYQVPGVHGLLRPVILMPVALLLKLPAEQLETLILHELAHIRRLDAIAHAIALCARSLLYFHPVVHRLGHELERHREILCDELVTAGPARRLDYARALSAVAAHRHPVPAALLGAGGGELSTRVHHILGLSQPRPARPWQGSQGPLLLALTTLILTLPLLLELPRDRVAVLRPQLQVVTQVLAPALLPDPAATAGTATPARAPRPVLAEPPPPLEGRQPSLPAAPPATARDAGPARFHTSGAVAGSQGPASLGASHRVPEIGNAPRAAGPAALALADSEGPAGQPIGTASPSGRSSVAANDPGLTESLAPPRAPQTVVAAARPSAAERPPAGTGALPGTGSAAADDLAPRRPNVLHMVHPSYPPAARRTGAEGSVELAYRVNQQGEAVDIQVLSATPAGLFENAAVSAMGRWQFASDSHGGHYRQIFDFNLAADAERCPVSTGSRICRH